MIAVSASAKPRYRQVPWRQLPETVRAAATKHHFHTTQVLAKWMNYEDCFWHNRSTLTWWKRVD